ncbi:MAG: alpha-1,4-glucan--maltose-1-phosphate maltosyltransferase [Mycobacteriales bacterium]
MVGRIAVVDVRPVVSCGTYPSRAVTGESVSVHATVFREGHDAVACNVAVTRPDGTASPFLRLNPVGPDQPDVWQAAFTVDAEGEWAFTVEGWSDPLGTWWHDAPLKVDAGVDVDLMLEEGARLYERTVAALPTSVPKKLRTSLAALAETLRDATKTPADRMKAALADPVVQVLAQHPVREFVTPSATHRISVDRQRALYGAWYELFPRSEGAHVPPDGGPMRSGTFKTAAKRLPAVAAMGFDVVYLPPIHPVGEVNRKGPNNTLTPSPHDPGSPWAIGSKEGGHDAVHPDLGTLADFDGFVEEARRLGMEVALDLALQCAPDHPWATEHPEWFTTRIDGTIAYAENPPKKYQDIYPVNFDNDTGGIYAEVLRIVRHWVSHGVKIFRVDNPHTKPLGFWEWLIAQVKSTDADVLFLAEAFTRPAMMHELGRVGFTQSYTYFTWRIGKTELTDYVHELVKASDYMRPNFFVNTPDILHASLQYGGPPVFKIRAVLAALLSPSYGVYAGYELFEHVAVKPGSEEYLDSEKYQYRPRDWSKPELTLAPYLTMLNRVRRAHPATHWLRNVHFHEVDSDMVMAWSKRTTLADGTEDVVLVVVNLDPHGAREATVRLDLPALGLDWEDTLSVHDHVSGERYDWGQSNYVRLDPFVEPAHIFTVSRSSS